MRASQQNNTMTSPTSADLTADVVVIGGGPGGSTAATMLARKGPRVLLLERARFPRDHIGESLLPASMPVLQELGVLPAVQAAGFVEKWGATMTWGRQQEPWSWYFKETSKQWPHTYLVGDAACFIDPLFSSGMHLAFTAGVLGAAGYPEGTPCSGLVANLVSMIDGRTTVSALLDRLRALGGTAPAEQIEQAALSALGIVHVDGTVDLCGSTPSLRSG